MPHALAALLRARHLDAAALADDALVADPLVLAAVALPVLGRTEDALAEEPVLLRLQGPVVDRLRLGYLSPAPGTDLLRGGKANLDRVEVIDVNHLAASSASSLPAPSVLPASPSSTTCSSRSSAAPLPSERTPVRSMPSSSAAFSRSSSSSASSTSPPSETTLASSERLWISFSSTLNDSGIEGSGMFSPLTIAS